MTDAATWVETLARQLESAPPDPRTVGALLRMSREVAHATERLNAPLCAYVAGRHVERRVAQGADVETALAEVEAAIRMLLPVPAEGSPGPQAS